MALTVARSSAPAGSTAFSSGQKANRSMFDNSVSMPGPRLPSLTKANSSLNIRVAAPEAGTNFTISNPAAAFS